MTLALSAGAYYLVDAPLRRARYASLGRRLALPGSVAAVGAILVAVVPLSTAATAAPTPAQLGRVHVSRDHGTTPVTTPVRSVFGVSLPPPIGTIKLGRHPSARHQLRVMFIGDSVMYQLQLAIGAALSSTGDATAVSYSSILGWSPRSATPASFFTTAISQTHPDIVVAMWTHDNVFVAEHGVAAYERLVLQPFLDVLMAPGNGVKGVVFVGQPPQPPLDSWMPRVHAEVYDPKGMQLWEDAAIDESREHPGRVAFAPATAMLEYGGGYSTWLPSPGGKLERVRQIDDFHLCLNGGVRYGAGATLQLTRLFGLAQPAPNWWLGSFASAQRWYQLPGYPPGQCPDRRAVPPASSPGAHRLPRGESRETPARRSLTESGSNPGFKPPAATSHGWSRASRAGRGVPARRRPPGTEPRAAGRRSRSLAPGSP